MTLPTLPASPPPGTEKDLVCGMDVDPTKTKDAVVHGGKDYFFCSAGCLEKFRREPEKYLAGGSGSGHEPMEPAAPAGGVEYTCPMHPEIVLPAPGSCPICGMALEPRTISLEDAPNPEFVGMKRRFLLSAALTVHTPSVEGRSQMTRRRAIASAAAAAFVLAAAGARAQDLASFEKRVATKTLDNGLTVVVCERPGAPVFSFFTHVNAGSVQEAAGQSGLAHMFEHMAFKGTDRIGTKDIAAERKALAKVEQAFFAYETERKKTAGRDDKRVADLEKAWRQAMTEADTFVVNNEFGEIISREGGVGLNAFTSSDETGYFFSMPANRLELWAYLESSRFSSPVFREFYKERDVVWEERRMRVDSNPIGRLVEQFLATAFSAHPYGRSGIGWPSDLKAYSATDAETFFKTYYVPSNMVVTVVGDLKAAEVFPVVEKYFSRLPKYLFP